MWNYELRYVGADRLPRNLSDVDVEVYFKLTKEDVEAINNRFKADRLPRAEDRKVGLAVQLVFLRATGRPLDRVKSVPPALLTGR